MKLSLKSMPLNFILLPTLLCPFLLSCKSRSLDADTMSTASENANSATESVGFYALDGSGNTCNPPDKKDVTAICQLFQASTNKTKAYFEGVKDFRFAHDMGQINDSAFQKICDDYKSGKISTALLVGYSRGAISALTVAHRINSDCHKSEKTDKDAKIVTWLGLLDAVETSVLLFGRQARDLGRARSIPDRISALHVFKNPIRTPGDDLGLFETTRLRVVEKSQSILEEENIQNILHGDIGRGIVEGTKLVGEDFEGYRLLKQGAEKFGGTFELKKTL